MIVLSLGLGSAFFTGCDRSPRTVSVTVEDYRFTPDRIHVKATTPLLLSVYNAGREEHEFASPILGYGANRSINASDGGSRSLPISLRPGQSLTVLVAPPPGTYLYVCPRKGHHGMSGIIIVE